MASLFGHAAAAISLGSAFSKPVRNTKFIVTGVICSILPDADVLSFKFGIRYEDFWGHRGFTHSLLFAVILGAAASMLFYREAKGHPAKWLLYFLYFSLCTASHGLLDGMTDGGRGVAFFSPFDNTRYFLPWRPIAVSPLGAGKFFSARGLHVIMSEAIWIGVPCLVFIMMVKVVKTQGSRTK